MSVVPCTAQGVLNNSIIIKDSLHCPCCWVPAIRHPPWCTRQTVLIRRITISHGSMELPCINAALCTHLLRRSSLTLDLRQTVWNSRLQRSCSRIQIAAAICMIKLGQHCYHDFSCVIPNTEFETVKPRQHRRQLSPQNGDKCHRERAERRQLPVWTRLNLPIYTARQLCVLFLRNLARLSAWF